MVTSEELLVDPMSIFVDPNLYRFCWNQFGDKYNRKIIGVQEGDKNDISFDAFRDNQYSNITYCISRRDRSNSYFLYLQMTKSSKSPNNMLFKIRFSLPLGPQLDIIHMSTVPKGVYFEVNPDFAGLPSNIGPTCRVLLMSESQREKVFLTFELKQMKIEFQKITPGFSFSIYYTCTMLKYFGFSTRFVAKTGFNGYDGKTTELEPIVQIPLRRFIMASWKHPARLRRRYDVAIYEKTNNGDVCIKLFRVHVNIFPKPKESSGKLAFKCDGNIPIEDLGEDFSGLGKGFLRVILDLVEPLRMYSKYKFAIYWKSPSGKVMNNYIPLSTLPNENSGNINKNFFLYGSLKYEDLINQISDMSQTMLSKNTENPYKGAALNISGYEDIDILSSMSTTNKDSLLPENMMKVNYLFQRCKKVNCQRNISPYFYAIYLMETSSGTFTEIVQLPILYDRNYAVKDLSFVPNDYESSFTLSWNLSEYSTTPAMFAVEIQFLENISCHSVYILRCKTCNGRYIQDTMDHIEKMKRKWRDDCISVLDLGGRYDAIASSVKVTTKIMPQFVHFHAKVFSFLSDFVAVSSSTNPAYITETPWQRNGKSIISSISGVFFIIAFVAIFVVYKYRTRKPKSKKEDIPKDKKFESGVYDADVYDADLYDDEI